VFANELASGLGVLVVAVGVLTYETVSFILLVRKHRRLLAYRIKLAEKLLDSDLKDGMVLRSEQYRQGVDVVRAAQAGVHIVVTKAPEGWTIASAQDRLDQILSPIYPTAPKKVLLANEKVRSKVITFKRKD
jgi:hypothetical protein